MFYDNDSNGNVESDNGATEIEDSILKNSFVLTINKEHKQKYNNISQYSRVAEILDGTKKRARRLKKATEPKLIKHVKKKAKRLLKDLNSGDIERAKAAAKRISKSNKFSGVEIPEILDAKVKHTLCLDVIAMERGFKDYTDLRLSLLKSERNGNVKAI